MRKFLLQFFYYNFSYINLLKCDYPWHPHKDQRRAYEGLFSPATVFVSRIQPRIYGLAVSALGC